MIIDLTWWSKMYYEQKIEFINNIIGENDAHDR